MAKVKNKTATAAWQDLFNLDIYKPSQGRVMRQSTAAGLGVVIAFGVWRLIQVLQGYDPGIRWGIPVSIAVVSAWLIFRLINLPQFADFLISTEAEMTKVSWPSRPELFRATFVVLATVFVLATSLFVFDLVWQLIFSKVGVLQF